MYKKCHHDSVKIEETKFPIAYCTWLSGSTEIQNNLLTAEPDEVQLKLPLPNNGSQVSISFD